MGVAAAVGALVSGIAAGSSLATLSFGFSAIGALSSFALSGLQRALAPKPKTNSPLFADNAEGITQNVRQAITSRVSVYGEVRVGGAITFIETTNNDEHLHMVITLCDHEVFDIGEIWFDDTPISPDQIDEDGIVRQGDYRNRARIKKYFGSIDQEADPDLISETSVDDSFKGSGVAYLYVRLTFDRDVYPTSIPVISAWVKGKTVVDARDGEKKYTSNSAMIAYDYMIQDKESFTPGVGVVEGDIDESSLIISANICDEIVITQHVDANVLSVDTDGSLIEIDADRIPFITGDQVQIISQGALPGGLATLTDYYVIIYQRVENEVSRPRIRLADSLADAMSGIWIDITDQGADELVIRKTGEPRYHSGGVIDTSVSPDRNMEDILSSMAGNAINIGGQWILMAGAYKSPIFQFDENDVISPINIRTKVSRSERFNRVKGVFASPLNDGEASDYPPVVNSFYEEQDEGRVIPIDHDLPMTQRPTTAQRIAKIRLEKHRQELFVEADFTLKAMSVRPGDNILLSNKRMGFFDKEFEVASWSLQSRDGGGAPILFVRMALQETDASVYEWNSGDETRVDPAKNTNLPNPFKVEVVGGFSLDSRLVSTQTGDRVFKVVASWMRHPSPFVTQGGRYEIQFKKSTESQYTSAKLVDGTANQEEINGLEPDIFYDFRIMAISNLGSVSSFVELTGFQVGSTLTTNTIDWENEAGMSQDWENETILSMDWEA